MNGEQKRLAVLIDADNSRHSMIGELLEEIANYGVASVKRIYGDWTDTKLKGWKASLLEHGIHPMQQFAYTTGKNATDSAMIIDAMDLLYTKSFDGFCIVSSDSDFTRLASRIREAGLMVYGFGERKTPKAFTAACDKFVYTENLRAAKVSEENAQSRREEQVRKDGELLGLLRRAVEDTADDSGWSYLGLIGQNLMNKSPDFDPRTYGFRKLGELIESTEEFEIREHDPLSNNYSVYVRPKRKKRSNRR